MPETGDPRIDDEKRGAVSGVCVRGHDMLFLLELIDGMLAVDDLVLRFGRPGGHSQGRLLRVVLGEQVTAVDLLALSILKIPLLLGSCPSRFNT